jgi:hypothetical protein
MNPDHERGRRDTVREVEVEEQGLAVDGTVLDVLVDGLGGNQGSKEEGQSKEC